MVKPNSLSRALLWFFMAFVLIVLIGRMVSTTKAGKSIGGGQVALLDAEGAITASDAGGSPFASGDVISSVKLCDDLYDIADDAGIHAVVLRVNSPGGSAAGSDEIYHAIRYVQSKGKPVVVSMGDVAASGGYYISSPADYIFANGATLTGSIGVIFELMNVEELAKKIGVQSIALHAGKYKDIGNPFRQMTPEEKQILTGMLSDVHNQFILAVADGRKKKLTEAQVRELATGQVWTGAGAVKVGLVDEVGDLRAAELKAKSLAHLDADAEVTEYGNHGFFESLFGSKLALPQPGLEQLLRRQAASGLSRLSNSLYLSTTLRDLVIR